VSLSTATVSRNENPSKTKTGWLTRGASIELALQRASGEYSYACTILSLLASQYYVGVTTPLYQDLIGWRLYPMHAGFCLISLITVYFVYPETAGVPLEVRRYSPSRLPARLILVSQEMDALFGDESIEDDEEGDDKDAEDEDDDEGSSFTGSGTPGSSMRSSSPTSFRRKNSSTPLVGNGGPVGMMKRMFNNMRRKETSGGYDQLNQ
jgi:hypothetical protein